jgi:hypothetical protein
VPQVRVSHDLNAGMVSTVTGIAVIFDLWLLCVFRSLGTFRQVSFNKQRARELRQAPRLAASDAAPSCATRATTAPSGSSVRSERRRGPELRHARRATARRRAASRLTASDDAAPSYGGKLAASDDAPELRQARGERRCGAELLLGSPRATTRPRRATTPPGAAASSPRDDAAPSCGGQARRERRRARELRRARGVRRRGPELRHARGERRRGAELLLGSPRATTRRRAAPWLEACEDGAPLARSSRRATRPRAAASLLRSTVPQVFR